jgi:hypothetical protein
MVEAAVLMWPRRDASARSPLTWPVSASTGPPTEVTTWQNRPLGRPDPLEPMTGVAAEN